MSTIYLSETANTLLINHLQSQGHNVKIIKKTDYTYYPVSTHPDIYMCHLGNRVYFGCPEKIGQKYPENIRYNAACTGRFFIHNLKYTDPDLLDSCNMEKIHVPQGYAKCNIVTVNESSIITSDEGIWKSCRDKLDTLLIQPGHIKLENFSYGFIGGASGRIGDTIYFNGNLANHPDYEKIAAFIESRDLKIKYFTEYPLEDIGSIIEVPPCPGTEAETDPLSSLF